MFGQRCLKLLPTAMADPVLLAVGPAIVTGLAGYTGARLQAKTARQEMQGEIERLRMQQRDQMRQQRQETYHELLSLFYRLDSMVSDLAKPLSRKSFADWVDKFNHQFSCIDLFGTDSVREAARRAKVVVGQIGLEARKESAQVDHFINCFVKAYRSHRESLDKAVGDTIEAMREDLLADISPKAKHSSALTL